MTTLILSVTRGPGDMINQTRHISSGLFQIGRAAPSDWVLEDPRCVMSKRHCVFRQDEAGWSVADVSRNGSFLASGPELVRLGAQPYRLNAGERLRLGDYELAVDLEEDEASFRAMPLPARKPTFDRRLQMPPPPDLPPLAARATEPLARREPERAWQPRPAAAPPGPATHPAANPGGLSALLEGALLAQDDVALSGTESGVLRAAGAALRATVSEIRRMRLATLGEPTETAPGADGAEARPLVQARTERDALCWLLAEERRYDVPAESAIQAAFSELRQHHDCLVGAARRGARSMFESLDPDEPERTMLPRWLDMLPGWRRARGQALARRRYRRLKSNLDRVVDQAIARAYIEMQSEAAGRWRAR